jgi:uncharacterized membrane protein YphA (DoxX/SURF4 family)
MNTQTASVYKKVDCVWWMLKLTYGIVPIVAGLDKFGIDFITHWSKYIAPQALTMTGISPTHIVYLAGIIEVVAGIIVLSKWTRFGAYLVAAWLLLIVVNLLMLGGVKDIAVRDIVIAIGGIALGMLTEVREELQKS